jgi:hypothetical protein
MTHLLNASGSETAMGHPCRLSYWDVEADRPISTIKGCEATVKYLILIHSKTKEYLSRRPIPARAAKLGVYRSNRTPTT